MNIGVEEKSGSTVVFVLDGKLDLNASKPLKDAVERMFPVKKNVVLHLGKVDFANSSGLGLLVSLLKSAKSYSVNLYICELQSYVKELFEVTQLNRIFEIYETLDDVMLKCEG